MYGAEDTTKAVVSMSVVKKVSSIPALHPDCSSMFQYGDTGYSP
jgi:hypothetical protein